MNCHIEEFIRSGIPWIALPDEIKAGLSNSELEYSKIVKQFSTKCQLRYRDNLVHTVYKDEKQYYKQMIEYCIENLMIYPYHLSDVFHTLKTSPFVYYSNMVRNLMNADRSYDSLPNFTAVDCLRILGIGRNQYIELMNQSRLQRGTSIQKLFKKRPVTELLPKQPVNIKIEPWWRVRLASVSEIDVTRSSLEEKELIDFLIAHKKHLAGKLNLRVLKLLYSRGLVFFDVPIEEDETVSLPPLDNFVMNRTSGDEMENLLYKLFQVLDETTTMRELSAVIDIDIKTILMVVSLMCRLGFCHKRKTAAIDVSSMHDSWTETADGDAIDESGGDVQKSSSEKPLLNTVIDFSNMDDITELLDYTSSVAKSPSSSDVASNSGTTQPLMKELEMSAEQNSSRPKLAFLFDSTLTAFLMMGNLTPGLKTHAVTMFEVGKLSDESMDSFISELEKVKLDIEEQEGEAQRYFDHAQILHKTLKLLRHNENITILEQKNSPGIDLLRCESLLNLDFDICQRLMQKNYQVLISMAPLSQEVLPVSCANPFHVGPFIPEMNSPWFKLFLYRTLRCGPPSLLLCRGFRLRQLPHMFQLYEKLLVTCWGHDSMVVSTNSCLVMLNDALCNMPVLIQGYSLYLQAADRTKYIPFPLSDNLELSISHSQLCESVSKSFDISNGFGFLTLVQSSNVISSQRAKSVHNETKDNDTEKQQISDEEISEMTIKEIHSMLDSSSESCPNAHKSEPSWMVFDLDFGLPLFDESLNGYVCDKIINSDIFSQTRQQSFLESNLSLSKKLLKFIWDCCEFEIDEESIDVESHIKKRTLLQMPISNVFYHNGAVKLWKF